MKNGNGHKPKAPARIASFSNVVPLLRENAPDGFRRARDLLFIRAQKLQTESPAELYVALKTAIELDRHAIFVEVAADKSRSKFDYEAYAKFQQWLSGETDIPVAVGLVGGHAAAPAGAQALPPADVDIEEEEEEHDEED